MSDNGRVRRENARRCEKREHVLRWSSHNERRRYAERGMQLGRDTDKGMRTKIEGWRTESEGRGGVGRRKKILPPTSLKPWLGTRVPRAAPGNFSMAPAELEFSLIFTFSRRPPRGSAIVRTASLGTPTTITEKMQRSEPEVYLPTNLPTNQPNGAKLSIATLSNKADPSLPCGTIVA